MDRWTRAYVRSEVGIDRGAPAFSQARAREERGGFLKQHRSGPVGGSTVRPRYPPTISIALGGAMLLFFPLVASRRPGPRQELFYVKLPFGLVTHHRFGRRDQDRPCQPHRRPRLSYVRPPSTGRLSSVGLPATCGFPAGRWAPREQERPKSPASPAEGPPAPVVTCRPREP